MSVSHKKRATRTTKAQKVNSYGLELREIKPKTISQRTVFETFFENHLLLHGIAGTGKTFISLFLALREVLEFNKYRRIIIIRSAVQTRDVGFMPGNIDEKMAYYETPYRDIVNSLCGRGDAYDVLKQHGTIQFMSTTFIRGLTLDDSIIVVDEIQNMTFSELDSVITRVGENTKVVLCGDFRQTDLKNIKERSGIQDFMKVIDQIKGIEHVEFQISDIVRSNFVKQYIIAKTDLNL